MREPKYQITAINKLTGEREVVSDRLSRQKCLDKIQDLRLKRRNNMPYKYYKMQICPPPVARVAV